MNIMSHPWSSLDHDHPNTVGSSSSFGFNSGMINYDDLNADDILAAAASANSPSPSLVQSQLHSGNPSPATSIPDNFAPNCNPLGIPSTSTMIGLPNTTVGDDASKSFPIILHALISDHHTDSAIHWLPCGTRFVISDKDEFTRNLLPRYFGGRSAGTTKFTSFTRRLKRWNFARVPSGQEMGAYYHEFFVQGQPELARKILYPENPKARGGGGGNSSKNKQGSPSGGKARPLVAKARRRASTGSMPPKFDELLANISPTPIGKEPLLDNCGGISPLPGLDPDDLTDWLSSADFKEPEQQGGELFGGLNTTPLVGIQAPSAEPSSIVSNSSSSFVLPPAAFSGSFVSHGSSAAMGHQVHHQGNFESRLGQMSSLVAGGRNMNTMGMMMQSPRTLMRRASVALDNLRPLPLVSDNSGHRMASNSSFNAAPAPVSSSQQMLLGTNFANRTPDVAESSPSSAALCMRMATTQNHAVQSMSVQPQSHGVQPQRHAGSNLHSIDDLDKEPLSLSGGGFSFEDDGSFVDPFT